MTRLLAALVIGTLCCALSLSATAQETKKPDTKTKAKEETLKGTITCAKCDLGLTKACATVIKVEDRVIYFDTKANGKYHKDTCTAPKEGEVVGVVTKKKVKTEEKEEVKVKSVKYKD